MEKGPWHSSGWTKKPEPGTWITPPPDGKRRRKRIGKSKQVAKLVLAEMNHQLSFERAGVTNPDITVKDLITRYESMIQPKLRPRSRTRYRTILDNFCVSLGDN